MAKGKLEFGMTIICPHCKAGKNVNKCKVCLGEGVVPWQPDPKKKINV